MSVRKIRLVFMKDLRAGLFSPVTWVAVVVFGLLSAFIFQVYFFKLLEMSRQADRALDAPYLLVRSYSGFVGSLILFVIPLLTMGAYSEEKRHGTHELLFTLPLTSLEIVVGKFLAGLVMVLLLLCQAMLSLVPMFFVANPSVMPLACALLGLVLFSAAILGIGQALSGLTDNQVVAACSTFALMLLLFLFDRYSSGTTLGVEGVMAYLSPLHHLDDFLNGVLDLSHTVFFLTVLVAGLFAAHQAVEAERNRR